MSTIRILPEILSNKIAAGEVVQRPSFVVKELVENSLDAGSTSISVEIEKGGKSLIRISDNGCGLYRDDALLSIERYATSKIFTTQDLFSISTMGFRGEALPSIASVSKFTLVTRTRESDIGTKIEIAGGKLFKVSDIGAPVGTMVEVKKLFFNTPARKKFLKSDNTEISHIADVISGIALGNPGIGFRLFLNKRLVKNFPSGQDFFQRSLAVLGKDVSGNLYSFKDEGQLVSVSGTCSNPAVTRSYSNRIYLFVNHRLVYDRGLVAAVIQGYRGRLMKGRFPLGAVSINIPFDHVDVNVHPSKREIKFSNPQSVYQAVSTAVANVLFWAQKNVTAYTGQDLVGPSAESGEIKKQDSQKNIYTHEKVDREVAFLSYGHLPGMADTERIEQARFQWPNSGSTDISKNKKSLSSLTILGQVMGTYIVAQKNNSLILVDQHAAHERVVYETLKKRNQALSVQSQTLLVPETLDLTHKEADLLNSILKDLSGLGIKIEPFGGTTFIVKSIPQLIEKKQIKPLVMEIIESFLETQNPSSKVNWLESCLISMACHTAIRANKTMLQREMVQLLEDLERCENPFHCPHGRPTIISFDAKQMEKLFKRVV
ncbi:MAG: DNA mismatch repair endonuclease MutL [Desulfobacula sp.]|jgi:DNA mismatch repair protein MutL|uniref:DNA mismatch repair endonuclease MutL n=1 Tax=Desulfobacula sp. TaxID=2593537 RepID=UPI001D545F94|nr:DNA mismatch repair endonuclease MutL [Desulfobacula sp.]MBT3485259.1 DNA mismatch repair endonuclease MutL [Desulfobacula sp.]MBT3804734.1 DNA mismatch repair endonuclease MutL [Desulfobacula sp.]MBT4025212.1 DNA mismatch repair endonuclease MutL [Desulfobacula sp.]MBT4200668.1 DNA mismatch repair endonuclease MutL [Desulfobacula sp.]